MGRCLPSPPVCLPVVRAKLVKGKHYQDGPAYKGLDTRKVLQQKHGNNGQKKIVSETVYIQCIKRIYIVIKFIKLLLFNLLITNQLQPLHLLPTTGFLMTT